MFQKKKSVNLTLEQHEFIKKNGLNLSEIVRCLIDQLMESDKKELILPVSNV